MGPESSLPVSEIVNAGGPLAALTVLYFCLQIALKLLKEFKSETAKDAITRAEDAETERNTVLLEMNKRVGELESQVEKLRTELAAQRDSHDNQLRDQDKEYRHRLQVQQTGFQQALEEMQKKNEYLILVNFRMRESMAAKGLDPDAIPLTDVPHSDGTEPRPS